VKAALYIEFRLYFHLFYRAIYMDRRNLLIEMVMFLPFYSLIFTYYWRFKDYGVILLFASENNRIFVVKFNN